MIVTAERSTLFEDRVLSADNLPTLPVVAMKVLELIQRPDVSVNQLARVIQHDPPLAARILKLANSSLFGMSKKIASIQQAMVVLGLRTVKVLALSFSMVDSFQGKDEGLFDLERYWRRSLTMAVGAKLLAEAATDSRRDEAFVGGLLADIGVLAAHRCAPQEYEQVLRTYAEGAVSLQDAEQALLGTTHAQLTGRLLAHWSLPEMLCDAIAAHHGQGLEKLSGRTRQLASVLCSAAMIADLFCGDADSTELEPTKARCRELTGVSNTALETLLSELETKVTETAALFCLRVGQTISYDQLRMQAMAQLASLSMDAEIGRVEAAHRAEQTRQALQELSDQAQELRQRASTDPLTGLANRQVFDDALDLALRQACEGEGQAGLILLDLDHFKRVNDEHGHPAGDEVLRAVGRCLGEHVQSPALAARYGGEEFAVIVPGEGAAQLSRLAENLRRHIAAQRVRHNSREIAFTASLGAAHADFKRERADASELIVRADECLYRAKRGGRNRVEVTF